MKRMTVLLASVGCVIFSALASKASDGAVAGDVLLLPAKSQFTYAEPVVFHVGISNPTPGSITVFTELQNGVGATYELSRDNGVFIDIAAGLHHDPVGKTQVLGPHDVYWHDEVLGYDWRKNTTLFQVGTNYLRVRYYGKISASVPIVVSVTPDDALEAANGRTMALPEVMKAIALRNVNQVRGELESVVDRGGAFSPYAAFFLAAYGGSDKPEEEERWANLADTNGFPLRAQTVLLKGEMAFRRGEFIKAWTEFEKIRRDYRSTAACCALEGNSRYRISRQEAEQKERAKRR